MVLGFVIVGKPENRRAGCSQEEMENLCNEIPADRLGMPEEAARMVLLLAQAPSYLTAQVITMDGGFL